MPSRPLPALRAALVAGALAALAGSAWAAPDGPDGRGRWALEQGIFSPDWNPVAPAQAAMAAGTQLAHRVSDQASELVLTAMNFLGVRYKRGGTDVATGFDCSGFTRHIVEAALGRVLPRRADEQASAAGLVAVRRDELRPGDLVFFNTLRRTFSHVGIYVGEGKFIHSPRPGGEVRVEDMGFAYWRKRFTGARRLDGLATAPTAPAAAPAVAARADGDGATRLVGPPPPGPAVAGVPF